VRLGVLSVVSNCRALGEGHCLDPEKLSYFVPDETIKEGEMSLKEVKRFLSE